MNPLGNRKVQLSVAGTVAALSTLGACACDDETDSQSINLGERIQEETRGATVPAAELSVKVNGQNKPQVQPGSKLTFNYTVTVSTADPPSNGWGPASGATVSNIKLNDRGRKASGNDCPLTVSFDGPGVKVKDGRRSVTFTCKGSGVADQDGGYDFGEKVDFLGDFSTKRPGGGPATLRISSQGKYRYSTIGPASSKAPKPAQTNAPAPKPSATKQSTTPTPTYTYSPTPT